MNERDALKCHIISRLNNKIPNNLDVVLSCFSIETYGRNEYVLKYGEISRKVYYVIDGHLQILYYDSNGDMWTRDFVSSDQWCCSLDSFMNELPATEEILSLTPIKMLSIEKAKFDTLLKQFLDFGRVYQQILTELYLETLNRIQYVLSKKAEDRIKWLYKYKRPYTKLYTAKNIASYLHLNKDVYSRINKNIIVE